MRTHGLFQSTNMIIQAARDFGIGYDCSILLPGTPNIRPHVFHYDGLSLVRVPHFWQDDVELSIPNPTWDIHDAIHHTPGLKVYDFHPVHVCLNTTSMALYRGLSAQVPLAGWTPEVVAAQRPAGPGPRDLFDGLLRHLRGGGAWIRQIDPAAWGE